MDAPPPSAVRALVNALALPELVARVAVLRGLEDPTEVTAFLRASLSDMPDPATMADIDRAAVQAGEKVTIYGDYDVDGVTSTAVLWLFFRDTFGVELDTYIPHRLREGYGLNLKAIDHLADTGTRVLVTVDNGSSAFAEIEHARDRGLDVIVVDHHQVSDPEPPAFAHLNPHRSGCDFPDDCLAAVGVVFLLLVQIRRKLREVSDFTGPLPRPDHYLDLVALGTVADVAPLRGLNRALVRYGVNLMRTRPRTGLQALMESSRCAPETMTARDLGFRLGPRINAAGRLDDATRGLRLLIGDDPAEARRLAALVEVQNQERRQIQGRMVEEALAMVRGDETLQRAPALILAGDDWHPGVVGIVASRVVEEFHRPAILLARDGNIYKGSARSTGDVNIKAALDGCAAHLMRYGGHVAAAGMTLRVDALDAFRAALAVEVERVRGPNPGPPPLEVDAEIELRHLRWADVEALQQIGPFGQGNPAPRFLSRGVVGEARALKGGHLKFFTQAADGACEGLAWNMESCAPWFEGPVDVVYTPIIETWRGRQRLVLKVTDLRPSLDTRA
jgi:single-stranded-DNA-specific exonuclease